MFKRKENHERFTQKDNTGTVITMGIVLQNKSI